VQLTTAQGLPSDQVNAIAFGPDRVAYIATSAGLAVFDGSTIKQVYTAAKDGLASDLVTSLLVASDGSLWVGVQGGFSRRLPDGTWQHFTSQGLFGGDANSDNFPQFAEDRRGGIWIATGYDGVYRFSKGAWKRLLSTDPGVGLPSNEVNCVTTAPDGALWFGTNGQGAARYDGQTWKDVRAGDGPLAGHVNDIYVDKQGAVWFATNAGISRLQP
jgi:ligand-binding sensor domain-containing protein